MYKTSHDTIRVGLAQVRPVWFDRKATLDKVLASLEKAQKESCQLVAFGEALVPGYPFWPELTGGAVFNSPIQKDFHATYMDQAVQIEAGHLKPLEAFCAQHEMAVYLGCIERPMDRGGHSLYCSMVYIDPKGVIQSVHRKLMPTYEERLTWSPGDGHGLQVHPLGPFTVGGLNCWENWMPLPRAALYGLGEDLHVAIWPGSIRNTKDITRFIAMESRSFVVSVSALMSRTDFPDNVPHREALLANCPEELTDGGSCVAAPDGSWVLEPQVGEEGLFTVDIDHLQVRRERQNFDAAGHYSRPDVTRLVVNRKRQATIELES